MDKTAIGKINILLLEKWDPIGISNTPGAEDEYHQYANDVYEIIKHSETYIPLFDYLWKIETEHMGLRGNKQKTEAFARLLYDEIKN
ncbi:MAG: hypothetical protein HYX48_01805 [Chlamydiales bacterium]|nr:hypothetical protein [Chlamydiales bacterium]